MNSVKQVMEVIDLILVMMLQQRSTLQRVQALPIMVGIAIAGYTGSGIGKDHSPGPL